MSNRFAETLASAALAMCFASCVTPSAGADPAPVGFGPANSSGWLAGAVAGYNWQKGRMVVGIEGDASWTSLKSETTGTFVDPSAPNFVFPSGDTFARIDWYGTVRARVGLVVGSFLVYGTGGLAYGNVSLSNRYDLGASGNAASVAPLGSHLSVCNTSMSISARSVLARWSRRRRSWGRVRPAPACMRSSRRSRSA